jgi:hypothetical protein
MIFVGNGSAENGHQTVTKELVDRAFVPMDLVHEEAETFVHDLVACLRVQFPKHGGRVCRVRKHDGHNFALALYRTACGKDFVDKVLGGLRIGSVEVQRFGFFGLAKIVAAPVTKITVGRTDLAALQAHQTHFTAAFVTKTCIWLLCSAFETPHRNPLFDFLEGEFLQSLKGDVNNLVIQASNNHSPVFGVEPEFVALDIPGKSDLVVTHLQYASPCFFQFQNSFTAVRGILDFGNIGPNVLGPWTATGRGG